MCNCCAPPTATTTGATHTTAVAENKNARLPVWDFVIHRSDGTFIRLHPHWSDTKVDTFRANGFDEAVVPPEKGLGAADYKGHFAAFRALMNDGLQLRFDAQRKPQGPTFYVGKPKKKAKDKTREVSPWADP